MTQNTTYLIDQLDESLSGSINPDFESNLRNNAELAEEWNTLQFALTAIREAGLQEQVAAIGEEYRSVKVVSMNKVSRTVRPMLGNTMKIAAAVFVLFVAGGIYKYNSVSSSNFYNKNFSVYELSVSRGNSGMDQLEKAYQNKNWAGVIEKYNALDKKDNKSMFLAAMSNMELKNVAGAIALFDEILKKNALGTDELFHDESEYYLALSYLANQEAAKAIPILERIKADKNHLYNRMVNDMSWTDLRIIQYKNSK
jgi:hypothetical protein